MNITKLLDTLKDPDALDEKSMRETMREATEFIEVCHQGFPIHGPSGLSIKYALSRLALTAGIGTVIIKKQYASDNGAMGKYIYVVEHSAD